MKSHCFRVDPYGVVVETLKSLPDEVKESANVTDQTLGLTWQDDKDEFSIYVWLQPSLFCKTKDPSDRLAQVSTRSSIIVHETVHIKQFIERAIGGKLDNETEAYLVQKVVEDLAKCLSHLWNL